ncbi:MAG TPA: ABC transporter substrate-binding protein [Stellaceae bacterium]|jgi:branched-chain amino acid transport system substrate-binding protein|nr:ABC transporter substrate-binding protein [Stellaceae bacterium]
MGRISHYTIALTAALTMGLVSHANAADPIKVGILGTTSGPYAIWGNSFKQTIDYFLDQYNGKDGNPTVEIIFRDVGGDNPPRARQLAQEMIVNDHVAIMGGLEFTTTVLGVADVMNQAKIPFVFFNSATASVTDKSPYFVRASFTSWQNYVPLAEWMLEKGRKKCEMFIADYSPGQDAIDAFSYAFKKGGGTMLEDIRVPMNTTDFSSYFQRVHDNNPDCLVDFMPGGPMSSGTLKGFADRGFAKQGMIMGGTSGTQFDFPAAGDAVLDAISSAVYAATVDNPENKAFVKGLVAKYGDKLVSGLPSFMNVEAWDGMTMIFHMLKATNGQPDADKMMAAIKGYSWKSPRGDVSVDPETRELTQPNYIMGVEKVNGTLTSKIIKAYPAVKDPWHELKKSGALPTK